MEELKVVLLVVQEVVEPQYEVLQEANSHQEVDQLHVVQVVVVVAELQLLVKIVVALHLNFFFLLVQVKEEVKEHLNLYEK